MKKQFTLGKKERLKSRKAIESLFGSGARFSAGPFRVHYLWQPLPGLAAGTGVSSRHFRKAVDRNRVKRLTREAWRLHKLPLQEQLAACGKGLHVFLTYTSKELPVYAEVAETMKAIINRFGNMLNENNTAHT